MTTTFTVAKINQAGRKALIEWLEVNLKESIHAEGFAGKMISEGDFGDPECSTARIELRGLHSRSGNPETYSFNKWEFDTVTYNENGEEVARERGE